MRPIAALLVYLSLGSGCGPTLDAVGREPGSITSGTLDPGHPSVGLLLVPTAPNKVGQCTGTLVGERTVLTAAHCLTFIGTYLFQLDRQYAVQRVLPHPWFDATLPKIPPDHDIGLVFLERPPEVKPSTVCTDAPRPGGELVLVGFGITADGADDGGVKRLVDNVVEQVRPTRFSVNGSGNLCQGDSGGPAFAVNGQEELVAGVTSASEGACGTSRSWETRVDAYWSWLKAEAAGDIILPGPPQVHIDAPANDATLLPAVKVEASVLDDGQVVQVGLQVDGKPGGTVSAPPFRFSLELAPGRHDLEVWAVDDGGREGQDAVSVSVVSGDLALGQTCTEDLECVSGRCLKEEADPYCTQTCTQDCPEGFSCRAADAICVRDGRGGGGCAVAPEGGTGEVPWLLLGLALVGLWRRGSP